jgi:hypothetical protein
MRFKQFILNEATAYLGQKVGDILTAAQELRDDANNMGTRDLTRFAERIVNQIRRILHSNWPREEKKHLLSLQKVGVALMKSIEDKDDLPGTIAGSVTALEKLVADLGIPIHKLATSDKAPEEDDSGVDKSQKNQAAPPPKPATIDKAGPVAPPTGGAGQDLTAQPLGGNTGQLDAL